MNVQPFARLDRVIHETGRLALMSLLAGASRLSFIEMRQAAGMSDGNLTSHLRSLQAAGYISSEKAAGPGRSLTTFALTPAGRKAFTAYIDLLEQILRDARPR